MNDIRTDKDYIHRYKDPMKIENEDDFGTDANDSYDNTNRP